MREARAYVAEYAQRSRQFTPAHADRYLESLRQASPEQMENWLSRFAAQRAAVRRGNEVQHRGREIAVQQSLDRLQAAQRSLDRIAAGQSASASAAQSQIAQQRRVADQAGALRRAVRDAQLSQWRTPAYDWLIFPPVYVQQMAAATLPGDLPAGDPRNEIRGDVPGSGD
jgi:hypothetical protein